MISSLRRSSPLSALALVALVAGCGSDPDRQFAEGTDAETDSAVGGDGTPNDSSPNDTSATDGEPEDTGSTVTDTGGTATDTGSTGSDTSTGTDTGGTVTDTGTPDTPAGDTCPATTLTVNATVPAAAIWASGSTTITAAGALTPTGTIAYAWTLVSKPVGSTAALAGATDTVRTLATDLPGPYVVRVTATAPCSVAKTSDVTITAHEASVFYEYLEDYSNNIGYLTVRKAGVTQGLPTNGSGRLIAYISETNDLGAYDRHASYTGDTWEGAPGVASKVVFSWYNGNTSPNTSPRVLYAGTSTTNAAIIYGPIADPDMTAANGQSMKLAQPRFSPNGNRIAFVKMPTNKTVKLTTVGSDGSSPRDVANYYFTTPSGDVDSSNTSRPQWLTDSVLGWARQYGTTNWEIVTASDSAGAIPSRSFLCGANNGKMPKMFMFLPNNPTTNALRVLVSFNSTAASSGVPATPGDLILYEPLTAGGTCNQVANLSNRTGTEFVHDFTLSPDKSKVAWIVKSGGTGGGAVMKTLFIRNSDGSGTVTSIPFTQSIGNAGPRYVAGGNRILLTLNGSPSTFPVTGAPVRVLEATASGVTLSHFGNGGCSTAGSPTGLGLVAAGLGAGLLLSRRRRHDEV